MYQKIPCQYVSFPVLNLLSASFFSTLCAGSSGISGSGLGTKESTFLQILHTSFAHLAHILHISCTHLAHILHTSCAHLAHTLHTSFTHLAHILRTPCTHLAHILHTSCAQLAHILHTSCTFTFTLHFKLTERPVVLLNAIFSSVRSSSGYHGLIEIQQQGHFFKFFKFFRF